MLTLGQFLLAVPPIIYLSHAMNRTEIIIGNFPPSDFENYPKYTIPDWSPWEFCPPFQYAVGVDVKLPNSGVYFTGINGICLYCAPLGGNIDKQNLSRTICSKVGPWGQTKKEPYKCPFLLKGFQMSVTTEVRSTKAVGPAFVKFFCTTGEEAIFTTDYHPPPGSHVECLFGQGICGIRTQVATTSLTSETYPGLLNVEMKCCNILVAGVDVGGCQAKDYWQERSVCNNALSTTTNQMCEYMQTIGTAKVNLSSLSNTEKFQNMAVQSTTMGYTAGMESTVKVDLSTSITHGSGLTTGHDWTKENSDTFTDATVALIKYECPPRTICRLWQIIGECGPYRVESSTIARVDTPFDASNTRPYPITLPSGFFCDKNSSYVKSVIPDPVLATNMTRKKVPPLSKKPISKPSVVNTRP